MRSARLRRTTLSKFCSTARGQATSSKSRLGPSGGAPSLLTRMSSRPNAATASATMQAQSSALRRSPRTATTPRRSRRGYARRPRRAPARGHGDARAFLGQQMGDRIADPLRRAVDDRDLSGETQIHISARGRPIVSRRWCGTPGPAPNQHSRGRASRRTGGHSGTGGNRPQTAPARRAGAGSRASIRR